MTIELTYRYSQLDKRHEFGLQFKNIEYTEVYIRWVYYYLGVQLQAKIEPHPYSIGKVIKEYKYCNNAQRQALLISNAINKKIETLK